MIAKRIDMREASKSRATRLAEYVMSEMDRAGRVADVFTVNCLSDDPLIAAKEMEVCQARNTRAKDDKTYHLLLSFPDGERPDGECLRGIAAAAAKALGYGEHQRVAVVHDDTDNLHMHLIINKIHPQRHTIHTPRYDFKILAELCGNLEKTHSLTPTNHVPAKTRTEFRASDMEKHSGTESFLHYARKKATTALSEAKTWGEAHQALAAAGIAVQARGNGLVVVDKTAGTAIKASSLGREFSKAQLEKRLGGFVADGVMQASAPPLPGGSHKPRSPRPLTGSPGLYQQYLGARHAKEQARKAALAALWDKQKALMQAAAEAGKVTLSPAAGRSSNRARRMRIRNAVNTSIAHIRRDMANARREIREKHKTRGFVEWLKLEAERGNIPAIYALRKRGAVAPALINITARDLQNARLIAGKISHITGRGTLFYRAGEDIFRDSGSHLSLKKDITGHGVKAALMIAMTKFNGQALTVNGSDELKAKCVEVAAREGLKLAFSDPDMERERRKREQAARQSSAVKEQNTQEDAPPKNGAGEKTHKRLRGSMER